MRWDIEELFEKAMADYLTEQVGGELSVYMAWEEFEMKYPAAICHVGRSEPVVESATWHDARTVMGLVQVVCEIAPETDDDGNTILTARDRNARARSKVLNALCSTSLLADLQAKIIETNDDVAVSMAQVSSVERAVEAEDRRYISTINIEAIIEPVTGSAWSQ